ncbi:SGNH/GDSL hydrolase family protein [Asticcacaulis sp. EMRT-3]|uniref:SGNH/GDSL hydrolase family protein n=1 Tax=Asticcacaulis sp. EMRT-3 TaxID=3040349 RepID=UPI0024AEE677|nr:SGNH/GDSL hydrolase family protein [Asticcacaulis sp. EMRT-3]MDI7774296.1 SGNH/GDSL hydrolase family protein [Asticcacaulis sp. EMRT-3]
MITRRLLLATCGLLAFSMPAFAHAATSGDPGWNATWASSQMVPTGENALSADNTSNITLRQVVHVSEGGPKIRIRVSNVMSSVPLEIKDVHVALGKLGSSAIDPATDSAVTFGGSTDVLVPASGEYISDPVDLNVADGASLAISLYIPGTITQQTGHPGSRATTYIMHGDHSDDADMKDAKTQANWFNLSGVDVDSGGSTIVALGDSITDGHAVENDSNGRWTDELAARLAGQNIAVINEGIGGNRLHLDGLGPNVIARLDRDVLGQAGAKWLIVFEGVNDLGTATRDAPIPPEAHTALVNQIIADYQQVIYRAHARGLKVYGATITPFTGNDYYHPDSQVEADRQAINSWIRTSGAFDAVIDFDALLRDPKAPDRLSAAYDSGDHLHPGMAGYKAMGDAIDLSLFK